MKTLCKVSLRFFIMSFKNLFTLCVKNLLHLVALQKIFRLYRVNPKGSRQLSHHCQEPSKLLNVFTHNVPVTHLCITLHLNCLGSPGWGSESQTKLESAIWSCVSPSYCPCDHIQRQPSLLPCSQDMYQTPYVSVLLAYVMSLYKLLVLVFLGVSIFSQQVCLNSSSFFYTAAALYS